MFYSRHRHAPSARAASSDGLRRRRVAVTISLLVLSGLALFAVRNTHAARQTAASGVTVPMAVQWKYTGVYFPSNPAAPVISEDTAYLATGNRLFAVDLQTGALRWRFPEEGNLPTFIQTTPTLDKGTLYVGTGEGLYAFDAKTGKQRWPRYSLRNAISTSPKVVGDTVYFSTDASRFYAINAKTGEALRGIWSQGKKDGVEIGADISADFTVDNGMMIYVTSDDVMHSLSLASGTTRWAQRLDGQSMAPVVNGENIYLAAGNTISAWRATSGQRKWVLPLPSAATAPPAVDDAGTAYVVTSDRYIYAIDARGRGLWKEAPRVEFEVVAQPLVSGNTLIVGTTGGGVYAFDTATGQLKWNYVIHPSATDANYIPMNANVISQPVVANNTLYVLTDDGTMTAFRRDAPDTSPPAVTIIAPEAGDSLNGRPPFRISARVVDEGSGLNLNTLSVKLDGTAIPRRLVERDLSDKPGYYFNPDTSTIEYETVETEAGRSTALADGHHSITVAVKDWKGNEVNKTWTFTTDDTLPRRAKRTNQPGGPGGRGGFPGGGGSGSGAGGKGGGN